MAKFDYAFQSFDYVSSWELQHAYLSVAMLYHDEGREQASIIDILAEYIEEVSRRTLTKLPSSLFEQIGTSPHL